MLNKLLVSIFLFYIRISNANETSALQEYEDSWFLSNLRNLCPYNKFCKSSPLKTLPDDDEPCCETCSCEEDCFETGSCCPDKSFSGPAAIKYPCKNVANFGKLDPYFVPNSEIRNWHRVIDECKDIMNARSHMRCFRPLQVKDYAIVSDEKTGKLYRNKHCAECNGIKKYLTLKLNVRCSKGQITNFSNAMERDKYLLENCLLIPLPPDRLFGISHCVPDTNVISSCNVTGNWEVYDKDIENACMTKNHSRRTAFRTLSDTSTSYTYFSNVFCFLCNKARSANKTDTCKKKNTVFDDQKSGGTVSIFALLDSDTMEDGMIKEETMCGLSHIWDPYTEVCRLLVCPVGHVPYFGICKGLITVYGYTLALYFEIIFKDVTIETNLFLLQVLEHRLLDELGNDIDCGRCLMVLFSFLNNSISQIFFRYEVFTNERCHYIVLMERLQKLAIKKEMTLKFRYLNQAIHITMTLKFGNIIGNAPINILVSFPNAVCKSIYFLNKSIIKFCSTIMLPEEEVSELDLNSISIVLADHPNQANDFQTTMHQVCVDTYFSARRARSSAVVSMTYLPVHDLTALRIVILLLKHTFRESS